MADANSLLFGPQAAQNFWAKPKQDQISQLVTLNPALKGTPDAKWDAFLGAARQKAQDEHHISFATPAPPAARNEVPEHLRRPAPDAAPEKSSTGQPPPAAAQPAFDTQIPAGRQAAYKQWLGDHSKVLGRDFSQDSENYDIQGFFLSGGRMDKPGMHGTDEFKKPNHPTFSNESRYSGKDGVGVGGRWEEKDGKTRFYASPENLKHQTAAQLQDYFKKREPNIELVLPQAPAPQPPATRTWMDEPRDPNRPPGLLRDLAEHPEKIQQGVHTAVEGVKSGAKWVAENAGPAVREAATDTGLFFGSAADRRKLGQKVIDKFIPPGGVAEDALVKTAKFGAGVEAGVEDVLSPTNVAAMATIELGGGVKFLAPVMKIAKWGLTGGQIARTTVSLANLIDNPTSEGAGKFATDLALIAPIAEFTKDPQSGKSVMEYLKGKLSGKTGPEAEKMKAAVVDAEAKAQPPETTPGWRERLTAAKDRLIPPKTRTEASAAQPGVTPPPAEPIEVAKEKASGKPKAKPVEKKAAPPVEVKRPQLNPDGTPTREVIEATLKNTNIGHNERAELLRQLDRLDKGKPVLVDSSPATPAPAPTPVVAAETPSVTPAPQEPVVEAPPVAAVTPTPAPAAAEVLASEAPAPTEQPAAAAAEPSTGFEEELPLHEPTHYTLQKLVAEYKDHGVDSVLFKNPRTGDQESVKMDATPEEIEQHARALGEAKTLEQTPDGEVTKGLKKRLTPVAGKPASAKIAEGLPKPGDEIMTEKIVKGYQVGTGMRYMRPSPTAQGMHEVEVEDGKEILLSTNDVLALFGGEPAMPEKAGGAVEGVKDRTDRPKKKKVAELSQAEKDKLADKREQERELEKLRAQNAKLKKADPAATEKANIKEKWVARVKELNNMESGLRGQELQKMNFNELAELEGESRVHGKFLEQIRGEMAKRPEFAAMWNKSGT